MEWYELEMESGLGLSRQGTQSVVEEVGATVRQNINAMDRRGCMIASTDETRIDSLHKGVGEVIEEHLTELYVEEEHATATSRPGLNLPINHGGETVGVIGITGLYSEAVGYRQVVKKMVEILIRENTEQDERRMGQRVLNHFLGDWMIGNGLMQPRILEERGFALGVDIAVPRRVMVAGARELEERASTAARQKLLEQVEQENTSLVGRGSLVLRSGGRQVILMKKCSDCQMEQLARRIRTAVLKKFNVRTVVGIDGRAEDIHMAYEQTNRARHSAGMAKQGILTYDGVALELFIEDLGDGVKAEYIHKLFKKYSYKELCRWVGLLKAYFESEGSLHVASQTLHIHKNTLTYKLKRLEELTGYDVRLVSQATVFYMAMLFFRDIKDEMEEVCSVEYII